MSLVSSSALPSLCNAVRRATGRPIQPEVSSFCGTNRRRNRPSWTGLGPWPTELASRSSVSKTQKRASEPGASSKLVSSLLGVRMPPQKYAGL